MTTISGKTALYTILADPIHHVQTPQAINRLLAERGIDAVMVPMQVRPQGLETVARALRELPNFRGCVVTVPHKSAMRALCDAVSDAARLIGAVNVVHRTADGRLLGGMLDGDGFVAGLRQHGIEPAGLHTYLAGAGGAASAIAFALAAAGVRTLTIANRSQDKARQLATRVAAAFPAVPVSVGGADVSGMELVVNGTSLGLHDGDPLPLDAQTLKPSQVVAEIIMDPAETPLLAAARALGCRVHPGAPMLASQVALMAAFMSGDDLQGMSAGHGADRDSAAASSGVQAQAGHDQQATRGTPR
jgi:shikimate dehydrogenase